jgi:hypothetical protein
MGNKASRPHAGSTQLRAMLWNDIHNLDTGVEFRPSRDAVPHLTEYDRFLNEHLNKGASADKLGRSYF